MSKSIGSSWIVLAVLALAPPAAPIAAQDATGIRADILREVTLAGQKFTGLAGTVPEDVYDWRPADGVRSVREVYLHIIGNNYNLAYGLGATAPASSDITRDYQSVVALETLDMPRTEVAERMRASFDFLQGAIREMSDASLDEAVSFFGQERTRRSILVLIGTHMHEHLGQSIAYARVNGVTPPWSR